MLNLVQILKSFAGGGDLSFEWLFRRKSIVERGLDMEMEWSQKAFV